MFLRPSPFVLAIVFSTIAASVAAGNSLGKKIDEFQLPDYLGQEHSLADLSDREAVVVAFLGTQCPLAKLYAARLQEIADDYEEQGVTVVAVMSNAQDSLAEIAAFVRKHDIQYLVLKDRGNQVADKFAAERTPQVFLLDRERKVRYVGRVDDQFLIGKQRDKPTRPDLRVAIDEVLQDNAVSVPTTDTVGCIIGRARTPNEESQVTYARDIAPILKARCVECHRADEIGPLELTSYEEAAGWGEMIAEVVRERRMPPWHADPRHGSFANNRSMPKEEIGLIEQWVKNGCPEGDPADLDEPQQFTEGWQLPRSPDLVLAMNETFVVPATPGPRGVPYQNFTVATGFTEDKWIAASEVRPGNRSVVHHTIVYVEPPGRKQKKRDRIFLAAYVPGLRFDPLPARSAKRIPAGSNLVFEMHYTPNGSKQRDRTEIGILFADVKEIDHEVVTTEIGNQDFVIPPGAKEHVVTATSRATKSELTLLSMSPHMHLRGSAFRYELVLPTGEREVLLDVPAYDFNWQTRYVLTEPRHLPIGSTIFCRAVFDNSESNLANPNPNQPVHWGDQSWEEMMLGFIDVMMPREQGRSGVKKPIQTGLDLVGMFEAADSDANDGLSETEVADHELLSKHFTTVDQNGDKLLQLGEILTAVRVLAAGRGGD